MSTSLKFEFISTNIAIVCMQILGPKLNFCHSVLDTKNDPDQKYIESLMVHYQTCFPSPDNDLFKSHQISAEFILKWNQSTLNSLAHFVNLLSEFQSYEKCDKEVILLHNIKAMQFILVTNIDSINENLVPFLPLLTYNAVSSQDLMKILLKIEQLKLSEKQMVLSLVLCLFNFPPKIFNGSQSTMKTVEDILKRTFIHEDWKWKIFSVNIKTLSVFSSLISKKTQALKYISN